MNLVAKQIREWIVEISHKSGHGHIPTCFSVVEMLISVYDTMKHDPKNPKWDQRDIFILSKGHAALAHYCTLANYSYFPINDVFAFGSYGSIFGCHADRKRVPGIEASTGSLGHGIGLAVGMALAFKIKKSSQRVFVIVGDGEANEGSVWEAVAVATHLKLSNLTILFDANNSQTRCQPIPNPEERFKAFGCNTVSVDGHNIEKLKHAISQQSDNVSVIVANTVKGYGSKMLVNDMWAWHRRSPTAEEFTMLMRELNETAV